MELDDTNISKTSDKLLNDINSLIDKFIITEDNLIFDDIVKAIQQFQPFPQLLDSKLRIFINKLLLCYSDNFLNKKIDKVTDFELKVAKIFYNLTKVRGYKTVSKCLSSDVNLINFVLGRLISVSANHNSCKFWELSFFLLLWLSILILVPFPLAKISGSLPQEVYQLSTNFLNKSGKDVDAAATLLSRFLSRSDNDRYFKAFIDSNFNLISWNNFNTSKKIGLLQTLNYLLKLIDQEKLAVEYLFKLSAFLNDSILPIEKSSAILKLVYKLLGKLAVLACNLDSMDVILKLSSTLMISINQKETVLRYTLSKQISKILKRLDESSRLDMIEFLLSQILDVNLLECNGNDLDVNINSESVNIEEYHTILLTFGESANSRILSRHSIELISRILKQTLFLEQHKLTYVVGSNVRDASCFIAWSLAKKYKTSELPDFFLLEVFKSLILCCINDQELMIRRAASAALQEIIGRHGNYILPKLIDVSDQLHRYKVLLIEFLDYTALGHTHSMLLSVKITQELNGLMYYDFVNHLLTYGIFQGKQASVTLHALLKDHISNIPEILDKLIKQFNPKSPKPGILYTIGELLPLLGQNQDQNYFNEIYLPLIKNFRYDRYKSPIVLGRDYIHFLTSLFKIYPNLQIQNDMSVVFEMTRSNNKDIELEFIAFSKVIRSLSKEFSVLWINHVTHGDLIACAGAGNCMELMKDHIPALLKLITDTRADCNIKGKLLKSISQYLRSNTLEINAHWTRIVITCLNDYTITNQGDVGSIVRFAALSLIEDNSDMFLSDTEIEKNLVRLAGELMDNIRRKSFKLLFRFRGEQSIGLPSGEEEYFKLLLKKYCEWYLNNKEVSVEFWKGYCFSGGSPNATDITVNRAIWMFFFNWEKNEVLQEDEAKRNVLLDILDCLKLSYNNNVSKNTKIRDKKIIWAGLKFWCNVLELNLNIPTCFKLNNIYIRVFNATRGQSADICLTAIRIFVNLYLRDTTLKNCSERIKYLSKNHPNPAVKQYALEALEEIRWETEENSLI